MPRGTILLGLLQKSTQVDMVDRLQLSHQLRDHASYPVGFRGALMQDQDSHLGFLSVIGDDANNSTFLRLSKRTILFTAKSSHALAVLTMAARRMVLSGESREVKVQVEDLVDMKHQERIVGYPPFLSQCANVYYVAWAAKRAWLGQPFDRPAPNLPVCPVFFLPSQIRDSPRSPVPRNPGSPLNP